MRYKLLTIFSAIFLCSSYAHAWDGTDSKGTPVEIEKGNLVRDGETIEYFDYGEGKYKTGTVQDISRYGSSVEVEVQDENTGETRTFDMDSH